VVYTDSPKAIANQKAVMEYLLINHPVDCAICDQAGECHLQDYSYQFGRGQARFAEQKIKQPKKDVGPHVLLYSDRCIMCTRCVRFTREVTGTNELIVEGRGAMEQIDLFPGMALDNELSANVIDMCPVGALLDKDFLFQQRVWFLTKTPSIDGITASGDNITIEHNKGVVYRIKPRTNLEVNRYWITDEVRYGWKFIHDEMRLTMPTIKGEEPFEDAEAPLAYEQAYERVNEGLGRAKKVAVMISPMLSCEEAFLYALWITQHHDDVTFGIGPVPRVGVDKVFKDGFKLYAEKAPNARGVRRVLEKMSEGAVLDYDEFERTVKGDPFIEGVFITGNYPSDWVTAELDEAVGDNRFVAVIDTLPNRLTKRADVVIPSATWAEKSGTFENANNRLQAFERAIPPIDFCKSDGQIALDLLASFAGSSAEGYNAANIRSRMGSEFGMGEFITDVHLPEQHREVEPDMQVVEL
jgi:NADH-quinone oxidoreductase subunit G